MKADGLLAWSWAETRLRDSRNYWIVTARPDGRPHAAPVWGVYVAGSVWFSTDPASVKHRNLEADPRVVVHVESGDEPVIVHGRAELRDAAGLRAAGAMEAVAGAYGAKYVDPDTGEPFDLDGLLGEDGDVWQVRPRIVLGWLEQEFVSTPTRWRFPA